MSRTTTYLPCPFCGAVPNVSGIAQTGYGVGCAWWRIVCRRCHADGPLGETVKEAIVRWNKREKKQ